MVDRLTDDIVFGLERHLAAEIDIPPKSMIEQNAYNFRMVHATDEKRDREIDCGCQFLSMT
jgi:hypothetical protein